MTIDLAIPAKVALFDRLGEEAESGRLPGIAVHYAWPGEVSDEVVVYGGGTRFVQEDDTAEQGAMIREIIAVSLYVRVVKRPACDVKETDLAAHAVGSLIGKVFIHNPLLAGPYTWLGIASGMSDYSRTADETTSILSYQARIGTRFSWYDGQ